MMAIRWLGAVAACWWCIYIIPWTWFAIPFGVLVGIGILVSRPQ